MTNNKTNSVLSLEAKNFVINVDLAIKIFLPTVREPFIERIKSLTKEIPLYIMKANLALNNGLHLDYINHTIKLCSKISSEFKLVQKYNHLENSLFELLQADLDDIKEMLLEEAENLTYKLAG